MTRFEQIKSMSVEEFATFLKEAENDEGYVVISCKECLWNHMLDNGDSFCDNENCHDAIVAYLNKEVGE